MRSVVRVKKRSARVCCAFLERETEKKKKKIERREEREEQEAKKRKKKVRERERDQLFYSPHFSGASFSHKRARA
jgi:hypothetical protein